MLLIFEVKIRSPCGGWCWNGTELRVFIVDFEVLQFFVDTARMRTLRGGVNRLMPYVKVKENEPFDVALRRFKRSCEKAGVLAEVRRREFYEKPTSVRKRKAAAAVKRHAKKVQRESRRMERLY